MRAILITVVAALVLLLAAATGPAVFAGHGGGELLRGESAASR